MLLCGNNNLRFSPVVDRIHLILMMILQLGGATLFLGVWATLGTMLPLTFQAVQWQTIGNLLNTEWDRFVDMVRQSVFEILYDQASERVLFAR